MTTVDNCPGDDDGQSRKRWALASRVLQCAANAAALVVPVSQNETAAVVAAVSFAVLSGSAVWCSTRS